MKLLEAVDSLAVAALCGVGLLAFAVALPLLLPLALVGWAWQWLGAWVAGDDRPKGDVV